MRINLAGFYYKYKNLQLNQGVDNQLITTNAARARLWGVEMNMTARPVDGLELNADVAYLNSEFQDYTTIDPAGLYTNQPLPNGTPANPDGTYDLAGNPLTYAPEWKLHGAIAYTFKAGDLNIRPRVDATYTSQVYHTPFMLPFLGQKGYTLLDLFLDFELPASGLTAGLFMKNVTNELYKVSSTTGAPWIGYPITGLVGAPRTFGISVGKTF